MPPAEPLTALRKEAPEGVAVAHGEEARSEGGGEDGGPAGVGDGGEGAKDQKEGEHGAEEKAAAEADAFFKIVRWWVSSMGGG